eukprot:scaffold16654_cov15-Tisochrysis_lutea.AAC.1
MNTAMGPKSCCDGSTRCSRRIRGPLQALNGTAGTTSTGEELMSWLKVRIQAGTPCVMFAMAFIAGRQLGMQFQFKKGI